MRTIKFRAWDKQEKEMVQVMAINWDINTGELEDISCTGYHDPVDRYELMQFTGLKDANGIEIFEGDIIKPNKRDGDENTVVNYLEVCGSDDMGLDMYGIPIYYSGGIVIGNIYQNPELLEGK